jgi:hypothetical protein
MLNCALVEMIKQLPEEDVDCNSLSFHGDNVYIGTYECIKWNVVTDTVVRLEGYPDGLLLHPM